jgi:hypothetical protein
LGTVVLRDVDARVTVVGNPARVLRQASAPALAEAGKSGAAWGGRAPSDAVRTVQHRVADPAADRGRK